MDKFLVLDDFIGRRQRIVILMANLIILGLFRLMFFLYKSFEVFVSTSFQPFFSFCLISFYQKKKKITFNIVKILFINIYTIFLDFLLLICVFFNKIKENFQRFTP